MRFIPSSSSFFLFLLRTLASVVLALFASSTLTGCTYEPGTILSAPETPAHAATKRGCLDVGATLASDAYVARADKPAYVVLYEIGNRCDDETVVDLVRVTATAVTADGEVLPLTAHDPHDELRPVFIAARDRGREALRYDLARRPTKRREDDGAEGRDGEGRGGGGRDREGRDGEGREGGRGRAPSPIVKVCVDLRRVVDEPVVAGEREVVCLDVPGDPGVVDLRTPGFARARESGGCESRRPSYELQDCTPFASSWAMTPMPRLRVDAGLTFASIGTADMRLAGKPGSFPASVLGERVYAGSYDVRISGFLTRGVYLGGEIGVGLGSAASRTVQAEGRAPVQIDAPTASFAFAAIGGVTTKRAGIVSGRAELAAGARVIALGTTPVATNASDPGGPIAGAQWMMMPRLGGDMWLGPYTSLGAWAGFDVLHTGDVAGGIVLAWHAAPFDRR